MLAKTMSSAASTSLPGCTPRTPQLGKVARPADPLPPPAQPRGAEREQGLHQGRAQEEDPHDRHMQHEKNICIAPVSCTTAIHP